MGNRKSELCSSNLALCNSINWNSVLSLKKHQNFISKSSCFRPSIVVYCFSYLYGINCIISLSLLVVCCSVYNFISLSFIVVLSISFFVYYVHLYIRMHLLSFLYSSPTCLVSFTVTITGSPRYSFCVFQTFIYRRCPT